jgi:hypothetical protein
VTLFTEELPWLKGRDLDLVMGAALCNRIGWPVPTDSKQYATDAAKTVRL